MPGNVRQGNKTHERGGTFVKNPNPDADKHQDILIWNAENWLYEDLEVGQRTRSIRRPISAGERTMFNDLVLDTHPYVADEVFAKEPALFGGRLIELASEESLG